MVSTIIHTPTNHNLVLPSRFQETNPTYPLTDSNVEVSDEKELKKEEIQKKEEEKPAGILVINLMLFKRTNYIYVIFIKKLHNKNK